MTTETRSAETHEPCFCAASTAREGHIHYGDAGVLCLHVEGEDASECPNKDDKE